MGQGEQGTELTSFAEIKAVHWSWPSKACRETSLGTLSLLNSSNPQTFPLELIAHRTSGARVNPTQSQGPGPREGQLCPEGASHPPTCW